MQQPPSDDANNSSLIYDRTTKVAKAEYADHGSHGVAAVPMPSDTGMMCYGNIGGRGLPSSVQMQHQMQQIAASMLQQQQLQSQQQLQQQQQQQQQMFSNSQQPNQLDSQLMQLQMQQLASAMLQQQMQQQNQMLQHFQAQQNGKQQYPMMPPPNAMGGQGYPSLVPGTVGSQQLLQALANNPNAFVGNNGMGIGVGPGMNVASANVINTTSSGLIDALNSQLSATQPPTNTFVESSLSQFGDVNGNASAGYITNHIGLNAASINDNLNMFAPGDIINGKKRVSPTVPLHPSQLVNSGGGYNVSLSSSLGGKMNSVLEEEDELSTNEDQKPQMVALDKAAEIGLMSAALETGKSHAQQKAEQNTGAIPSSAPQDSMEGKERGPVLTNPSKPSANGGLDNVEGNLIVHQGDIFRIPRKSMHSHPPTPNESSYEARGEDICDDEIVEYEVMSLLGQGTFAQVFHCVEMKTGENVAVKIVKNKPAYTRQAAVEIDVFRKLSTIGIGSSEKDEGDTSAMSSTVDSNTGMSNSKELSHGSTSTADGTISSGGNGDAIIRLMYYFMHQSHLCLVFEMLGSNLYELLKKRQFRGLPLGVVKTLLRQAIEGIKLLGKKNVVHCDLKPENMLMVRNDAVDEMIAKSTSVNETGEANGHKNNEVDGDVADPSADDEEQWIKLIDFGSACFEGQTTHTYIQSRFYRSPEVLVGLPYDSAIDMWSLGCVAAELFLGLPILPGVHEHDQLGRILEMIGNLPGWMLEQGSKSKKFFKVSTSIPSSKFDLDASMKEGSVQRTRWEFRSRQEYINYLSEEEKQSKGGAHKLEQQPTSRYFKKKKLEDIVMHHGSGKTKKEKEELGLFVHFLKGLLEPDPWKRYTAFQASMHPFLSGSKSYRVKMEMGKDGTKSTPMPYDISWVQPWDPSIPRRKLMVVQKKGSRRSSIPTQQSVPEAAAAENPYLLPARTLDIYGTPLRNAMKLEPQSPAMSVTSQMAAMADAMSLGRQPSSLGQNSPPPSLYNGMQGFPPSFGNAAGMGIPMSYQQLASSYQQLAGSYQNFAGRRLSGNMVNSSAQQQPQAHDANESYFIPIPHMPPPPPLMGAQSFSGAYYNGAPGYHQILESELGYALQRPGVVPGGNDFLLNALQRQYSNSSLGSLNNLPSPTRNYGNYGAPGVMNYPGNNILHTLGLQEQIADMNSQYNGGGGISGAAATSLLAQQLADYSEPSQQGGMTAQAANLDAPQFQRQQSNSSMHGSYLGSYLGQATPMSLGNSLPYFHSSSFGDYGSGQQIPAQHLNAIVNANLLSQAQANGQNQKKPNGSEQHDHGK
jgi:dual specificity protein kinase YAK1